MDMCKSVSSFHVEDTKLLDTLADDTRSYMPPTDARRHRSAVARVVHMAQDRPDLDVVACILAKTMAHPEIGDEWPVKRVCVGTSRAGHDKLNPVSIKARPRSWWCRQTVLGHRASPLAGLIQEAGCLAIFFITGARFKPVSLLALVKPRFTRKSKVCKSC